MEINTAAAVIAFASRLENESASFYEHCAARYREAGNTFGSFAEENMRTEKLVKRAYYGAISDALEACFSFAGLNGAEYLIQTEFPEGTDYGEMLKNSIDMEKRIQGFYQRAGDLLRALLPGVSRALEKAANLREERKLKLDSLLIGLSPRGAQAIRKGLFQAEL